MRLILSSSKYIMLLPAISNVFAAGVLMIYSAIYTFIVIFKLLTKSLTEQIHKEFIFKTAISLIEIVDMVLIATVILISGLGLYELFIAQGDLKLPNWLKVRTIDDLKEKLIKTIIAAIAVQFLVAVVNGIPNLLSYGAAVAIVIVALTIFTNFSPSKSAKKSEDDDKKIQKIVEVVTDRFIESLNQPTNVTSINRGDYRDYRDREPSRNYR